MTGTTIFIRPGHRRRNPELHRKAAKFIAIEGRGK